MLVTKTGHEGPIGSNLSIGPGSFGCEFDLYVADLDGDRRDDLVVMRGGKLIKLISRGDGTFRTGANESWVDHRYARCAISDLDGDGRADIACTSGGMLHVARWWSHATYTLAGIGIGGEKDHLVTSGDFNADGLADITIATKTGSTWTLHAGASNGNGFTWETQPTPWGHGAATELDALTSGDFDGDGKSDVMLIRAVTGPDVVHIGLAAKGATAPFRLSQVASVPWLDGEPLAAVGGGTDPPVGAPGISTGDFNADGKTDLMIKGAWARGRGDGQFDPPGIGVSCRGPLHLSGLRVAPDLNGDGRDDVLCTADDLDNMEIKLSARITNTPAEDSHGWMQADVTGDGVAELVRVNHLAPGYRITMVSPVTQLRTTFDVTTASTGGVGLDEAASDRWIAMDVGSPSGGPDGKADLVPVDKGSGARAHTLWVYSLLSVGDGTFTLRIDEPWRDANNNVTAYGHGDLQNWRPADLDGDGNRDLVHLVSPPWAGVTVEYLRARGDGTWSNGSKHYFSGVSLRAVHDFLIADVSGDGLSDLIHAETTPFVGDSHIRTLLGNGDGQFTERVQSSSMVGFPDMRRMRVADLNGDGMADLAHVVSGGPSSQLSELRVASYLSNGNGGWHQRDFSLSHPEEVDLFEDGNLVRFLDIDGDGRDDLVHVSTYVDAGGQRKTAIVVGRNPGADGFRPNSWQLTNNLTFASYDHDPWRWQAYRDPTTGDPGLLYVHPNQSQAYIFHRGHDHVTRVANGTGGAMQITYATLIGQRAYLPEGSLPELVTAVEIRDESRTPVGSEWLDYRYGEARYSHVLRRRLGFSWLYEREHGSAQLTYTTFDDQCGARPSQSVTLGPARTGLSTIYSYRYSYRAIGYVNPGSADPFLRNGPFTCDAYLFDDYQCEASPSCRLVRREQRGLDAYGNVISTLTTADQALASLSYQPPKASCSPAEPETIRCKANAAAYIVDKPAYTATYGHDGQTWAMKSFSTFAYDGNEWRDGPGTLGELRTIGAWDDRASTYQITMLAYDAYGQLKRTEDPRGQVKTVEYDATYHLFPTTSCEGAGVLCVEQTFDPVLGRLTSSTDANRAPTELKYDAHGRPTKAIRADGGATVTRYLDIGVVTGPEAQRQRIRTEITDGSAGGGVVWTEAFLDGLGRTYRTSREGGATQDTRFVAASRQPDAISLVYPAGGVPSGWTSYAYDALGRTLVRTAPDGSERRTEFAIGKTTSTDEDGRRKTAYVDGRGLIIQIDEHTGTTAASTHYHYDGLGRLMRVVDHLGNTTTTTHDMLGRKVSIIDPDRGLATYQYFGNGLLKEVVDAAGQTMRFDYDALGRRKYREDLDYKGRVTRAVNWSWDRDESGATAGASLGRVVAVADHNKQVGAVVTMSYGYDLLGNAVDSQQCVDKSCLAMGFAYDQAGRLRSITYPDATGAVSKNSETVVHTYDDAGRLRTVGGYATALTYDLDDQLTGTIYGNGVTTTIGRDPLRRWVDTVEVTPPCRNTPFGCALPIKDLYHATYVHYQSGRIHQLEESNPNPTSMGYEFDELGRLIGVYSNDPAREERFAFDLIGRLKWSPQIGDVHYDDPLHVHAPTRTDWGYTRAYERVGNVTVLRDPGGRSIIMSWTVDGRLASLTNTGNGRVTSYAYDPSGARVRKQSGAEVSAYFGSLVELRGGDLITYYVAGDRLLARREGNQVFYYTQDLVHSTRAVTNAFGRSSTATTTRHLAGPSIAARASRRTTSSAAAAPTTRAV